MRVLKIEEGKATIEIDGDEMCIIREGLNSMKDKTCFGADRRDTLINDISAIYSIATYHKIPKMELTPRVALVKVNTGNEESEEEWHRKSAFDPLLMKNKGSEVY